MKKKIKIEKKIQILSLRSRILIFFVDCFFQMFSLFLKVRAQPDKRIVFSISDGDIMFFKSNDVLHALRDRLHHYLDNFEFFDFDSEYYQLIVHDAEVDAVESFENTIELFSNTALLITVWDSPVLANLVVNAGK